MLSLNFSPFPSLETQRLVLRRPLATDDRETFAIRSDKDVNRYLDRQRPETITDAQQFLEKLNNGIENNESIAWVINRRGDNMLLGSVCLWNISRENDIAEIGFELATAHQGQGIMSEAIVPVLEYGFKEMQLNVIEGWVHKDNQRSIRLLKKFGFVRNCAAEMKHLGQKYFNDMEIYRLANKLCTSFL